MRKLESRIEQAFKKYDATIDLLKEFMASKRNAQEFILLVCARLDSLSNIAFTGKSQKDNFVNFLIRHCGFKTSIQEISLPDLQWFLNSQLWILPGTIKKPGRLHIFDPRRDKQFLSFLWNSGLAITEEEIGTFLEFIIASIKKRYRVAPTQSMQKKSMDTIDNIYKYLHVLAQQYRKGIYGEAIKRIRLMLTDFSLGALLYTKYRCGIIHEYGVDVDREGFFSKKMAYWRTVYNPYIEPGKLMEIQFPAHFLLNLLVNTLQSYKTELQKTKRLPWDLFDQICDFTTELEYLDDRSVSSGKDIDISFQ